VRRQERSVEGNWYDIQISDPDLLSGASVAAFMRPLLDLVQARWVFVCDLDGGAITLTENTLISTTAFLASVGTASQYDWGFFFLYRDRPAPQYWEGKGDRERIAAADLTVQLFDDTAFIVYTRDADVDADLMRRYPKAKRRIAPLSALVIPY
jgi:hypothetical protein